MVSYKFQIFVQVLNTFCHNQKSCFYDFAMKIIHLTMCTYMQYEDLITKYEQNETGCVLLCCGQLMFTFISTLNCTNEIILLILKLHSLRDVCFNVTKTFQGRLFYWDVKYDKSYHSYINYIYFFTHFIFVWLLLINVKWNYTVSKKNWN